MAALIVIGVIAFLAIDGYILYRVFAAPMRAGDHGAVPVPGSDNFTLPAGKLKLTYQESYKARSTDDSIDFGTPAALVVAVAPVAGGDPLAIKAPGFGGMGSSLSTGSGWSRSVIGTVEIVEPGSYTVTAGPSLEGAVEPQVLVGT